MMYISGYIDERWCLIKFLSVWMGFDDKKEAFIAFFLYIYLIKT